jgi:hypothetical protein
MIAESAMTGAWLVTQSNDVTIALTSDNVALALTCNNVAVALTSNNVTIASTSVIAKSAITPGTQSNDIATDYSGLTD